MQFYDYIIFSDGSSRGNPGKGGWGAITFEKQTEIVTEIGGAEEHTTNNAMEIFATMNALELIKYKQGRVALLTDSSYLKNGIESWINAWRNNGWKTKANTPVANKGLWIGLEEIIKAREEKKSAVDILQISGHAGVLGNERADKIATSFATNKHIKLFHGSSKEYLFDFRNLDLVANSEFVKRDKSRKSKAGGWYLSLIDGQVYRDALWSECEKRVKGVSGVKFKKVFSKEEEGEVLSGWQNQSL